MAKSCLYVNKPEDVDEGVLRQLIDRAWNADSNAGS